MVRKSVPPPTGKRIQVVETKNLAELSSLAEVPPTNEVEVAVEDQNFGYVIEHFVDKRSGKVTFTKVSTLIEPNRARTLLLHRPSIKFPIGSKIAFELGEFEGKPTVVNPVLLERESQVGKVIDYITSTDVAAHRDLKELHIPQLIEGYLKDGKDAKPADYLKKIGINYIVGVVENRLIYCGND